ncbi:MAG TPA: winged helix-turn-helix transcriptional regulator [Nitrososphaera sp.]|nr:winged helix-turn-helix transcriptional regulator [Nitrososphaera sp.]
MNEDLEGNPKDILDFIREHPGCHLRQIRSEIGVSMGTAQYHLSRLEKAGKIASNRHGFYRYYFPAGLFQDNEKNLLQLMSHETSRDIVMFVIEQKNPTQTEIAERVGVSAASVSWHVARLVQYQVIAETREGKFKRYHMIADSKSLAMLMKSYYPSLWDRWSNRLAEMFLSLSPTGEGAKQ